MDYRVTLSACGPNHERMRTNLDDGDPDLRPELESGEGDRIVISVTVTAGGRDAAKEQATRRVQAALVRPSELVVEEVDVVELAADGGADEAGPLA